MCVCVCVCVWALESQLRPLVKYILLGIHRVILCPTNDLKISDRKSVHMQPPLASCKGLQVHCWPTAHLQRVEGGRPADLFKCKQGTFTPHASCSPQDRQGLASLPRAAAQTAAGKHCLQFRVRELHLL